MDIVGDGFVGVIPSECSRASQVSCSTQQTEMQSGAKVL